MIVIKIQLFKLSIFQPKPSENLDLKKKKSAVKPSYQLTLIYIFWEFFNVYVYKYKLPEIRSKRSKLNLSIDDFHWNNYTDLHESIR